MPRSRGCRATGIPRPRCTTRRSSRSVSRSSTWRSSPAGGSSSSEWERSKPMKTSFAIVAAVCTVFAAARAQAQESVGYVEAVAQSAFGNVTSQSYGVELGYTGGGNIGFFIEAGAVGHVATSELSANAQAIAATLTQLQPSAVSFSVKQPVTFGALGLRYQVAMPDSPVVPYVMGGFGVARMKNDVQFQIGGADVAQFVTLGTDLTGSETKGMLTLGG